MAFRENLGSPVISGAKTCYENFERLVNLCALERAATTGGIEDAFFRFKLWAGNVGVLHNPKFNNFLDIELRQTPKIVEQIVLTLEDLRESLEDACSIANHTRVNHVNTTEDFGFLNSAEEGADEMAEIFESVTDSIHNLFRISMVIRDCTEIDRKTNSTWSSSLMISSESSSCEHDVAGVKEKFSALVAKDKDWLAVRLGNAIAQRRQYLKYCSERYEKAGKQRENHNEIASPPSEKTENHQKTPSSTEKKANLLSNPCGTRYVSEASTEDLTARDRSSNQPDISNETSVEKNDSMFDLQVIPLQDISKNQSCFDCIYCWQSQTHETQKAWENHVFEDIKPYICTFRDCKAEPFADEHAWFTHEMQTHRKRWKCFFCLEAFFQTPDRYREHLEELHENIHITKSLLPALMELSQQPIIEFSPSDCLFCHDWELHLRKSSQNEKADEKLLVDVDQFKRHVGAHLKQLALLATPQHREYGDSASSNRDLDDLPCSSADIRGSITGHLQIRQKGELSDTSTSTENAASAIAAPPSSQLIAKTTFAIQKEVISDLGRSSFVAKSNESSSGPGSFEYCVNDLPSSHAQLRQISGKSPAEEPQPQSSTADESMTGKLQKRPSPSKSLKIPISKSNTHKYDPQNSTSEKRKTLQSEIYYQWYWYCRSCRSGTPHSTRHYQCANPLCLVIRPYDDQGVDWERHPDP
ncbi:hypothetical protein GLAREA_04344 [Glarea lozoyensis ATCC 20868]|uniref:C2H2-type domain-containing protein n=1 Tax=Glarea lozoyensis (strain ATCC 20868 / MF5171) TaxID=1116229 RepID=S3DLZ6_GLAL2|nr:uncharacterized protein GLAREA_04344 [Glarea lozoyensis ATCC 20868]EPE27553.1 hypothetical protein GLAREA_04344 [Glarea lozoyensis ATCC 20868]